MSFVSNDPSSAFESISLSSRDLIQQLSGDFLPSTFCGLHTSSFGATRDNPFFKLKEIVLDLKIPIEDRMRAARYMDRIPHKDKLINTIEACNFIIDDESCPIGERYFFFSNNEKILKLSDHVVRGCHLHFYISSKDKKQYPLILRLLSAQFIYLTFLHNDPAWTDAREFITKLAQDRDETVRIRSEAADILCRKVMRDDAEIGFRVITELGELYMKNRMSSIYTNAQNAHNEVITESVMSIIRILISSKTIKTNDENNDEKIDTFTGDALSTKVEQTSGDIYERLLKLTENFEDSRKTKILSAFSFILIYPAKYEGVTLMDVLCLVWNKIYSQPGDIKKELEQRVIQELTDMNEGSCGSGLVCRIVNVLSGYIQEEGLEIKMSVRDQLRANIFARLQTNLRIIPESEQEAILNEISEEHSKKETAKEFVETYSVKSELEEEFVNAKLIKPEEFNDIYNKSISDFLGIDEKDLAK